MKTISALTYRLTRKSRIRRATLRYWDPAINASGSLWLDGALGIVFGLIIASFFVGA